ncbi:hypothetical protein ACLJK8_23020, partial [Amaricoccus sp. W119]
WLPRGADLDTISEDHIQEIAMTINLTPRKCLGYTSPVEVCAQGRWGIRASEEAVRPVVRRSR